VENISGNAILIRDLNINLVRKVLKFKKNATKQQIAEASGLSIVTVGTVLKYLLKQNEVFEAQLSPSNGGRPAQNYRYNDNFELILILFPYEKDGNIIIHSVVVNLFGECVFETNNVVEDVELKSFEQAIEPMVISYPAVKSIGFGHPGIEINGQIINSDYKNLIGTSFVEHFSNLYHMPVIVENDANAAVIGFRRRKELAEDCNMAYLYFPDKHPPGAGIFINGKLIKGKKNYAGEISAMPLGIKWKEVIHESFDLINESISKLIISICSILNPDIIVLNGNFLKKEHLTAISQNCNNYLSDNILPDIMLSDNFIADYQSGLISQTFSRLEQDIVITRKFR